ncbi:hypothetical protein ACOSQ2_027454 [Xanthoceras sorbifolium]
MNPSYQKIKGKLLFPSKHKFPKKSLSISEPKYLALSSSTSMSSDSDESETVNVSRLLIADRPFAESSRTRSDEPIIEHDPPDSPHYTNLRPEFPPQSSDKATNGPWFSLEGKKS